MLHQYWRGLLVVWCLFTSVSIVIANPMAVLANKQTDDFSSSEINIELNKSDEKKIQFELSQQDLTPENQQFSPEPVEPVTSVNQLSDVQPTDWAYRALQSIIERYGCMAGYPDGTFGGNHAINRYEFAAALNACIDILHQMVEKIRDNYATQAELEVLKRLQEEFARELAELSPRLEPIQRKIQRLQLRPVFSTTSQLLGKAIMAVSVVGGNDIDNSNIILSQRTELDIDSSFSGKDRLRVRLTARNTPRFGRITDTDMTNLSFAGDNRNNFEVNQISYRFRPIKQMQVFVAADGGSFTNFINSLNSPISSGAIGAISNFSEQSAIYDLSGSAGGGFEYRFSDAVRLSLGYMAGGRPNDPSQGITGGEFGAIAQLTLQPNNSLSLGLTYIRAYNTIDTGKGSEFANEPFEDSTTSANAYGVQTSWRMNQDVTLSGWVGLIDATAESAPYKGSRASILTWAATLAINDIGGDGNLLGFVLGQPPKVISSDVADRKDPNTALHFEAFYRLRLADNLYITPGFFVIFNPEHNAGNDPIYVGTIRKTFLF